MSTSTNWRELEQRILKVIKTPARPVAVAFLDAKLRDDARGRREQLSHSEFDGR